MGRQNSDRLLKVEAVVLRHSNWGEADRILVLYTREQGKLRAIAKGARRLHSRKGGHLEPFTRVALMLAKGRDLWIVTQAEAVDLYFPIREDLLRTGFAVYVLELLDRFTYEEGENLALYSLLVDTLQRIAYENQLFHAIRYYEIRLLDLLGFRPELFNCLHCHSEIKPEDQYFSFVEGGILCPRCGSKMGGNHPVSMLALKYMRHFQRSSYKQALKADIPEKIQQEMENLLESYLTYLLERNLNSTSFLREIRDKYSI